MSVETTELSKEVVRKTAGCSHRTSLVRLGLSDKSQLVRIRFRADVKRDQRSVRLKTGVLGGQGMHRLRPLKGLSLSKYTLGDKQTLANNWVIVVIIGCSRRVQHDGILSKGERMYRMYSPRILVD
ncbi:hypothetical protein PoB_000314600 [Plakobranchus ocellatus]|uniref:Uncharacterized protein n=1 Tax=Plakobranchus ocellatus TaxID=259542 RepID=A0AAV3XGN1_9GAST|nr:hypothetical protein PoB_000314600 [Plakobranchus ocellatus]